MTRSESKKMKLVQEHITLKKNHQTPGDFVLQMETLFEHLFGLCAKDAFICFVIGRSKIHGEIIENEKLIADIGVRVGLNHISTIERGSDPGESLLISLTLG